MDSPTSPAQFHSSVHAGSIVSSLLSFPDSSPISNAFSFDRELEKALASASDDVFVQDSLLNRTTQLASLLIDSTKRCFLKRASAHNSNSWFLPTELTIKVFSKLDTKSQMQAAACCTMFNKCAMDRLSYAHIDLTTATKQADNEQVVCTMIHRAGKELRSLKLGRICADVPDSSLQMVNASFLWLLSVNHGFLGRGLRSLRIYNSQVVNDSSIIQVLSVCSNLTDLRIVGWYSSSMHIYETLTQKCHLLEHLCFMNRYGPYSTVDSETGSHLIEFVTNSPNLASLTLIWLQLTEEVARTLAESSRTLKYLNLSRSSISGRFLRDLGNSCKESSLETLIMRNCYKLEEKEVLELCNSLIKGKCKSIRHIDVSSNYGLVSVYGVRSHKPKLPLEKLKEERPDVTFVADFPLERSGKRYHVWGGGDDEELREIEVVGL